MLLFRNSFTVLILSASAFFGLEIAAAQETIQTPSQKTKEAVDKLDQAPSAITKTLGTLKGAVDSKLQGLIRNKTDPSRKNNGDDLTIPAKEKEAPEPPRFSGQGKRDPFRPATMRARPVSHRAPRENLSPLERFDLGQLKLVGVVWDIEEPRAMIEDSAGLGYVVKVGTPMGVNEGKIKAIGPNEIVVEEFYEDNHGARKKRQVNMRLVTE
jgi:type IV pilus assembly protein PilP